MMIDWTAACQYLSRTDSRLAGLVERFRGERLTTRGDCFKTLANAIVGQQISVRAAAAIWRRLESRLEAITPETVVAVASEALRFCGLSRPKAEYLGSIAAAFRSGQISGDQLAALDDSAALAMLCQLRGVGRWTAEMVLIFHGERPDILPLGDIALLRAAAQNYGWETTNRAWLATKLAERAQDWRPYRTVAVWYLWRSLDPEPVAY